MDKPCKIAQGDKVFTYFRLIESYRTDKGPRPRTILNLGKLYIDKKDFKALANRIEEIVYNQMIIYPVSEEIEKLAQHYAACIIKSNILNTQSPTTKTYDYQNIDINSLKNTDVRALVENKLYANHSICLKLI